jgi:hypothetical protein
MEHDPARRNSLLRFSEFCEGIDRDRNRSNKKRVPKKYGPSAVEPDSCSRYDVSNGTRQPEANASFTNAMHVIPEP